MTSYENNNNLNDNHQEEPVTILNPKNFPFEPRPVETPSPIIKQEPVEPVTSILREDQPIPGIIDSMIDQDQGSSSSTSNNTTTVWPAIEDAQSFVSGAVGSLSESMKHGITKTIDSARKSYEHARDQCGEVISLMMTGSLNSSSPLVDAEKEFNESKKQLRENIESIRAWTDSTKLFDVNSETQLSSSTVTELRDRDVKSREAWDRFDSSREALERCYLDSFRAAAREYSQSSSTTSTSEVQDASTESTESSVNKRVKVDEEKERVDRFYFVDLRFTKEVLEYIRERLTTAEVLIHRADCCGSSSGSSSSAGEEIKSDQEDVSVTAVDIRERLRTMNMIVEERVKEADCKGSQFGADTVDAAVNKVRQQEEQEGEVNNKGKLAESDRLDGQEAFSINATGGQ